MPWESNSAIADPAFDLPHLCQYFSQFSPQPMLAVQGETCIVRHVNAAFLHLADTRRSNLIGRPFAESVPKLERNGCVAMLERVYRTGTPEALAEQQHADAPPMYWSYAGWAILGGDDRPAGVMIQVADSTETALFRGRATAMNQALLRSGIRQQELAESSDAMNTRLQAAVNDREYFIAVLSHELRTPLTPVLLAASMLRQDLRLDSDIRESMQMIHRNITLEARLIDDLLDMTRIQRGKLKMDCRPVDLREALRGAVEVCSMDMDAGNLTIDADLRTRPQIVNADAGRLQQVFSNLIRNAIKFSPAGGSIRVRSDEQCESFVVEVSDGGAGIDPEFLPLAFGAFEQGEKGLNRKAGLGLGLSICKTIVDLHGGVITAHSDGKGLGSTFTVKLPIMRAAETLRSDPGPTLPDAPPRLGPCESCLSKIMPILQSCCAACSESKGIRWNGGRMWQPD